MLSLRCVKRGGSVVNAWRRTPSTTTSIRRQQQFYYSSEASRQPSQQQKRKVIFSGIQPTGVPHLGNYLGALREWFRLQQNAGADDALIFSLVDQHAITVHQDPKQLRQWKKESLAILLAIGLDPKRCILFHQSDVPAHVEMMWILSRQASTGYLGRMTQWKDKTTNLIRGNSTSADTPKPGLSLFAYPVLQAADVLVHGATHVPVGEDQVQHLEFSRELATSFNHSYGKGILTPPTTLISPAKRVMSLVNPNAKMSKSAVNPKSRILLTDSTEAIGMKLKSALTDSVEGVTYDPAVRPGVSNLVDAILYTSDGEYGSQEDVVRDLQGASMRALKEKAAESVERAIGPVREQYFEFIADERMLREIATDGAERAKQNAGVVLKRAQRAIGFDW
ncbi:tryptophanyl-tRNA synthetase [Polychaeton citri CBS 116435]|uniref:tryptophan--tRNA ligase n=1 Tax=Polychaeton citri CBS 116435 TaxID=1314669 RepID=A0A9P4Q7J5_9PEZI|nr:tryptophanyl-tRNA synthetase [Polychaeton citri CBS 116435]